MALTANDGKCHCIACEAFWTGGQHDLKNLAKAHAEWPSSRPPETRELLLQESRKITHPSKIAKAWRDHDVGGKLVMSLLRILMGAMILFLGGTVIFIIGVGIYALITEVGVVALLAVPVLVACYFVGKAAIH